MDKIPSDLITGLNKSVQIDTTQYKTPIEAIMAERKNKSVGDMLPKPPEEVQPPVPKFIEVDGFILPSDAMTMMVYALVTSTDSKIQRTLQKFNFKFCDLNGKVVYPTSPRKTKRKKK